MKQKIEICMGSSCFSRGNARTLELVESFLEDHDIREQVELKGRLCTGACASGPCLTINETSYTNTLPNEVEELLRHHFTPRRSAQ